MADVAANGAGDGATDDALGKKIIRQVEFYFGDFNLMRDNFMREKIKENDGWFAMDVMLKFKRLSTLCSEPTTILEALKQSKNGLLEVDIQGQRIRRKANREVPQDNEQYRAQLKARTVYVKGFQNDENIDDINDYLSEYGIIEGVQLQRTQDKKFKGSLFATFSKQDDAERFIDAPMVYYKCNELTKMSKSEFYKQQETDKKAKKRKSEDSRKEKEFAENEDLKGITAMKVSGLDDDTILHTDVKEVFNSIDIKTIRFFDRIEKNGSEGYLIFQDERTADALLKILEEEKGSVKVQIKSAEVEFSAPNEEEIKFIQESYIEARQRMFGGRGKKNQHNSRQQRRKKPGQQQKHNRGKKTTFDSDEEGTESSKRPATEDAQPPEAKQAKTE